MPTKFRGTIFIKRGEDFSEDFVFFYMLLICLGDYVLVEDIEEGDKVKAQIVQILLRDNIRHIRSQNCW